MNDRTVVFELNRIILGKTTIELYKERDNCHYQITKLNTIHMEMNVSSPQWTHYTKLEPFLAVAERSIELPADGQNGECIVHYRGSYDKYEMRVILANGKREGEAVVHNDGVLVAVLEYKNGRCVKEVLYENEKKGKMTWDLSLKNVIRSLDDETKRILRNTVAEGRDDVLSVYDIDQACVYIVLRIGTTYYQLKWSINQSSLIVADLRDRELNVYENGRRKEISSRTDNCIDLDVNGRRWEGNVFNHNPCGYGILFDEEGRKEYEGFMVNGLKSGFGTEYYSDINQVKYNGCYCNDKRFGSGVLYDRNGCIDYDGLWKNDRPVSSDFDGCTFDSRTESIHMAADSFNRVSSFILSLPLQSMKRIVIGNDCFANVRLFELNELRSLESVSISNRSFSHIKDDQVLWNTRCEGGICRILNCPRLQSIQIGDYSFSDYQFLELTNLPSLDSVSWGECCFVHTQKFSLTGLHID